MTRNARGQVVDRVLTDPTGQPVADDHVNTGVTGDTPSGVHMERFMRSIKQECLHRMIFFGDHSLRNATREFLAHYHVERNHQGLESRLIDPGEQVGQSNGAIACRERLGGMLKYYHRAA